MGYGRERKEGGTKVKNRAKKAYSHLAEGPLGFSVIWGNLSDLATKICCMTMLNMSRV